LLDESAERFDAGLLLAASITIVELDTPTVGLWVAEGLG